MVAGQIRRFSIEWKPLSPTVGLMETAGIFPVGLAS
jgi:hypothetical protein